MNLTQAISSKIINQAQAAQLAFGSKHFGKKVVFTNGCFDVLHYGHFDYLSRARDLGDILIVGLNSDDSVRLLKGNDRPVNDVNARAFALASMLMVDAVVVFEEETPANLIRTIEPDVLVKGGDYRPEVVVGRDYAGKVEILPFVPGYSSSAIIDKLNP